MLMIIWEVKKEKEIPKNAIAQTIGYFIASNVVTEISDNPNKLKPALGLVTSQSECKFIFFPFKSAKNKLCLDALVSKAFPLIEDSRLNMDIFGVIIHYFDDVICTEPSHIVCNPKETYQAYVETTKISYTELQICTNSLPLPLMASQPKFQPQKDVYLTTAYLAE